MKAAVFHGQGDVRVEDVPEDTVGSTDVRIDVAWAGICGTDLGEYEAGPIFIPEEPHPRTGVTYPVTLGHEFSGVISEVGDDVDDVAVGDHVTVVPNIPCYDCYYCEEGNYNICPNISAIGLQTDTGGFSENAVVPAQQVQKLPDSVSLEQGALVEPLSVGLHSVRQSGLSSADNVAVFGAGPIGLSVVQAVRTAGAKQVFVSEPQDLRRETALELGADVAIDPSEEDAVETITAQTPGGVDVAFEYAGVPASVEGAIQSTRGAGVIVLGSIFEEEITMDLNPIVFSEREVRGALAYDYPPLSSRSEFDAIIRLLDAGKIDTDTFVSKKIDLDDIVEEGFECLGPHARENHTKILVSP